MYVCVYVVYVIHTKLFMYLEMNEIYTRVDQKNIFIIIIFINIKNKFTLAKMKICVGI